MHEALGTIHSTTKKRRNEEKSILPNNIQSFSKNLTTTWVDIG
jgi:hypothetical protein